MQFKRPLNARLHPFQNPAHIRHGETVPERDAAVDVYLLRPVQASDGALNHEDHAGTRSAS